MARLARVVGAELPHHVTQRGTRRQQVFFEREDYQLYLDFLATHCAAAGVEVWAYCLMPNHVHLILVPGDTDGLRAALGEAHRRYTRHINFRVGWQGYLWQGRFASFAIYWPARDMWSSIRSAPAWRARRGPGNGRARGRI